MRSLLVPLALASAAVLPTLATVSPAEARIVCKDGFQLSGGAWISTPYCNDEYLATVARRHGVNVSGNELRSDQGAKDEVCRFLSGNPTARDYCPDDGSSSRGR
ncbi:hypothetical protein [Hyphomicrobium sp.]|uniref:hypothetical protein n=1 Tax=Hyphomicrobium sp. TaxID=82 RepID=UPI002FDE7953